MGKKLYRFDLYCGRQGSLEGTFAADPRKVRAAMGKRIYFGEVLGKHSEVECVLEAKHLKILTDDADFIAKATEYGLVPSGFDPLAVLADDAAEARRAKKYEREHPTG